MSTYPGVASADQAQGLRDIAAAMEAEREHVAALNALGELREQVQRYREVDGSYEFFTIRADAVLAGGGR